MKSTGLCEVVLPCIQEDSSKITDSPEYLTPLGHTFFEAFLWVIKTLLSCGNVGKNPQDIPVTKRKV